MPGRLILHVFFGLVLLFGPGAVFGQDRGAAAVTPGDPVVVPVVADPAEARKAAADTTLRYWELDLAKGVFPLNLDADVTAVGTFFTAPFDGAVERVDFELTTAGGRPGVAGTGALRIKLIPVSQLLDPSSPGVDSVDVDLDDLTARGGVTLNRLSNAIDVSDRAFTLTAGEEYFMQLALLDPSPGAALTFLFDGGSADTTDTRYYPARTFVYLTGAAVPAGSEEGYFRLRNSVTPSLVNLNVLLDLQLRNDEEPPPPPVTGFVQVVHNAPGMDAVDVYVDGERRVDDLAFRAATPPVSVSAGVRVVEVVPGDAPNNETPLHTATADVPKNGLLIAAVLPDTLVAVPFPLGGDADGTTFAALHGAAAPEAVDLYRLDTTADHAVVDTVAQELSVGAISMPFSLPAGADSVTIAVTRSADDEVLDVYRFSPPGGLSTGFISQLLLTSGDPADGTFSLLLVVSSGLVIAPSGDCATLCVSTAAADAPAVPDGFALHGNYPNPFNPTTTIAFDLAAPGFTTLAVFDLTGRRVATPVAASLPAGAHTAVFDASGLPGGLYVYRLQSGPFTAYRTLVLVK